MVRLFFCAFYIFTGLHNTSFRWCNCYNKGGWWEYECRSAKEIETAYQLKSNEVEILLCGDLYVIDFVKMRQFQKSLPHKKRNIKRDLKRQGPCKGIAGILGI